MKNCEMKISAMAAVAALSMAAAAAGADTNAVKRATLDIKVEKPQFDYAHVYVYPTPPKDGSGWRVQCRTAESEWENLETFYGVPTFFRCIRVTNGYSFDPETTDVEDYREAFATLSKVDYGRWQRVKELAIRYDEYEREHGTSPNHLLYTIEQIINEARASERENGK